MEWEGNLLPRTGRFVSGEMADFLREAIIPSLLIDGIRPAGGGAGFLDGVIVTLRAIGLNGIALEQVRVCDAFRAVNFGAIIHATELGPAFLSEGNDACFEFEE